MSKTDVKQYKLAASQKWFSYQERVNKKVYEDALYVVGEVYYVESGFDIDAMEKAFFDILDWHDSVRLRFVRKPLGTRQYVAEPDIRGDQSFERKRRRMTAAIFLPRRISLSSFVKTSVSFACWFRQTGSASRQASLAHFGRRPRRLMGSREFE